MSSSEYRPGIYSSRVEFDFTGHDTWRAVSADDPLHLHGIDSPGGDDSQTRMYEVVVHIPDLNGDCPRAIFQGFTYPPGSPDQTCLEPGPACTPAYINAMAGHHLIRIPIDCSVTVDEYSLFYDFEVYFDGEPSGWIEFPN